LPIRLAGKSPQHMQVTACDAGESRAEGEHVLRQERCIERNKDVRAGSVGSACSAIC
jgi:hypothetical protein